MDVAKYCAEQKYKIRCNTICPGPIHTELWEEILQQNLEQYEKMLANVVADISVGRMGTPEEVAEQIVNVTCSEYMNGTEIIIDGGYCLGRARSHIREIGASV